MTSETPPWEEIPIEQVEPISLDGDAPDPVALDSMLSDLATDPRKLDHTAARIRDAAVAAVRERAVDRFRIRALDLKGTPPKTVSDVRHEAVGAAGDHDVLFALGSAMLAGATEAKAIAGELVSELPGNRRTLKVADGHGFELTIATSARRELSVNVDEIVDVIAAWSAAGYCGPEGKTAEYIYASGIREGIAALRELLSTTPAFRKTALDALATRLDGAGEETLAGRLRKAYGQVEKGEPSTKLERKPLDVKPAKK